MSAVAVEGGFVPPIAKAAVCVPHPLAKLLAAGKSPVAVHVLPSYKYASDFIVVV